MLRLARWSAAAIVAMSMTAGSLAVVSWMNDDPLPQQHQAERLGPRAIPVVAPPPPRSPDQTRTAQAPVFAAAAATPAPLVPAPEAAPPQVSGLAPTAGPGTLSLGLPGGGLPSMGALPGSELPTEAVARGQQTPARPRSRPRPRYPRLAQRQGVEGFVTLRLRIDAAGRVVDAVVVKSEPDDVFDDAALQTARRYRFTPARRGGEAVESTLQQTIRFELQR